MPSPTPEHDLPRLPRLLTPRSFAVLPLCAVRIALSEVTRDVDECLKVVAQIQEGLRVPVNGALLKVHDGIEVLEDGCSRRGSHPVMIA